ncbi:biotin-dependent carboxyltransferase family protein [Rhizobiaceae bacterium BDR2-2]|uniref:Biotin-dependent carboxyltransferase family protein n=1 Tax=Ectorhizobium quercum TaxID=2965071 RepID=A0AAE3N4I3_9HYPH|nr:biotin-dependent carboxyltransferase family protein [Ectorhizobium quercum]MCX8998372.1 biotin-dependent carboxyltransferase family protein [Ectorhizobium quercum]
MTGEITIHRAGMLATIQDAGRHGMLRHGVSSSGAVDQQAYAIANALVGNAQGAAVIEYAMVGGSFSVDRDCLVAVTGGECALTIGGKTARPWESHRVRRGEQVTIDPLKGATWGYIAVSGGIEVPVVLGSRSTHLRFGMGGLEGRVLADGDRLPLGPEPDGSPLKMTSVLPRPDAPVRVVPGPQDDYFTPDMLHVFFSRPFAPGPMRDRMAMILEGPQLTAAHGHDIVSDGTRAGSIQVPLSGRAIVLMADSQTTGGYPKIATVISADFPRLAQMPTGQTFLWRRVTADHAEELALAARRRLEEIVATLAPSQPVGGGKRHRKETRAP